MAVDGAPTTHQDAATRVVAATARPEAGSTSAGHPQPTAPGLSAADRQEAPASVESWRAVVDELYRRRAEAFATRSADALSGVYASGSAAPDAENLGALTAAGETLRGFAPAVVEVSSAEVDGDRASLELVDVWPDYAVVPADRPDGTPLRTVEGRGRARVRLVLVRSSAGWRIESGQRLA
jgi:hypothetical protein